MQEVRIERMAQGGDGVARLTDGRVVFVPRGLPGDLLKIEIEQQKKSWARAKIVSIVEASPDRIGADCPHFDRCGGCDFRHATYDGELRGKVEAARDTVERIGKFTPPDGEVVGAEEIDGYRIRARLHRRGKKLGYFEAGTNDVFEVKVCPVLHPTLAAKLDDVRGLLDQTNGELELETAGDGEILIGFDGKVPRGLVLKLSELDGVRGARVNDEVRGTYGVDGEEWLGIEGAPNLPGGRFRQANGTMLPRLRQLTARRLGQGTSLVELFAGSGSFTFGVAGAFTKVCAYELDERAVVTGNAVATELGRDHVSFANMDLDNDLPDIGAKDVVLLDPPRTGARLAIEELLSVRPRKIVYVSCDVATFARDARLLVEGGYSATSLDFVDMFPRTSHLEAIGTFEVG